MKEFNCESCPLYQKKDPLCCAVRHDQLRADLERTDLEIKNIDGTVKVIPAYSVDQSSYLERDRFGVRLLIWVGESPELDLAKDGMDDLAQESIDQMILFHPDWFSTELKRGCPIISETT